LNFSFIVAKPVFLIYTELFCCTVLCCPVWVIVIKFISLLFSYVCLYQHYNHIFICLSAWSGYRSCPCWPSHILVALQACQGCREILFSPLSPSQSSCCLQVGRVLICWLLLFCVYIHATCLTCLYD